MIKTTCLILSIILVAQSLGIQSLSQDLNGVDYGGNMTCITKSGSKCQNSQQYLFNSKPHPNYFWGCYDLPSTTCRNYVKPFDVYTCSGCSNTCCMQFVGIAPFCIPDSNKTLCSASFEQVQNIRVQQLTLE